MKVAYDFHIHTALSPCGDADMTPNNIVNMAILKGLDAIAITDHNTCANAKACMDCAKETNLVVIPGMEVETAEECHIVCLFADIESALCMENVIDEHLPKIKNRTDIFGEQVIMDSQDNIVGYRENMLVTATTLSINQVADFARGFGGVAIPAHIDKSSYSILSNLGFIDDNLGFKTVEVKHLNKLDEIYEEKELSRFRIIHSSDAHYLWDLSEKEHFIEARSLDAGEIIHSLLK